MTPDPDEAVAKLTARLDAQEIRVEVLSRMLRAMAERASFLRRQYRVANAAWEAAAAREATCQPPAALSASKGPTPVVDRGARYEFEQEHH